MRDGPALVLACLGAGSRRRGRELSPFTTQQSTRATSHTEEVAPKAAALNRYLRSINQAAKPGPSSWRGSLLPRIHKTLGEMWHRDQLTPDAIQLWTAGTIALLITRNDSNKSGGTNRDPQDCAKLLKNWWNAHTPRRKRKASQPWTQLEKEMPDGAALITRTLQGWANEEHRHPTRQACAVATIDVKKDYGQAPRSTCLKGLRQQSKVMAAVLATQWSVLRFRGRCTKHDSTTQQRSTSTTQPRYSPLHASYLQKSATRLQRQRAESGFLGRKRLRSSPNNSDAREEVSWVWGQQQHRTNTSHNTSQQPRKASPHNQHCNDTSSSRFFVDTLKNTSLGIDEVAQHTACVFLSKSAARVDDYDIRIAQYDSNKDRLIPSAALTKEAAQHAYAAAWVNDTQQRARLPVCLERVGL